MQKYGFLDICRVNSQSLQVSFKTMGKELVKLGG